MIMEYKKVINFLKRNNIPFNIEEIGKNIHVRINRYINLVFNNRYENRYSDDRATIKPSLKAEQNKFYVAILDCKKTRQLVDWAKENDYTEFNDYNSSQFGTWKFGDFENFKDFCLFVKTFYDSTKFTVKESMNLVEAEQILNENGYLIEKHVKKDTILYHGCRTGNLIIDYNRENEIWLTPDVQMAVDYACKRPANYWDKHKIVTSINKNSKSRVYKIKLKTDVNMLDLTQESDRKLFLDKALELNGITDCSEKDYKKHLDSLKIDYSRFVKYFYGLHAFNDFKKTVELLGFDGVISNEMGFRASVHNDWKTLGYGEGISYYIFNLKKIEVLDVLTGEELKPYLEHNWKKANNAVWVFK